jgi:hypothetical protein
MTIRPGAGSAMPVQRNALAEKLMTTTVSSDLVVFSMYEWQRGITAGTNRQANAVLNNSEARADMEDEEGWGNHIEGACGEQAVAKFLNIYWEGHNKYQDEPDLKPNIEVKQRSEHWHDLIIREHENFQQVFILATGLSPKFRIRGWVWGEHVQDKKFWKSPNKRPEAYFIPQSYLSQDWRTLKEQYIWPYA